MAPLGVQSLLDGLDGIAYVTDCEGTVVSIGRSNWNAFAKANGGESLCDGNGVLGCSVFSFVTGPAVAELYRRWFDAVLHGRAPRSRVLTRCDSPTVQRELMVTITPLVGSHGRIEAMLFQSQTLSEEIRPKISLFDFAAERRRLSGQPALPVLAMCSYCQNVRFPAGSSDDIGTWMSAERYYQQGGATDVRISHGICPDCFARETLALAS